MGILLGGNSPWEAACLRNSIVTMTKAFVLFIYLGRGEQKKVGEENNERD